MGRLRRWGPPLVLLAGSLASGGVAAAIEAGVPDDPAPIGGPRLGTPVVSARRMPTVVAEPIAARRLHDDLEAWVTTQPPDTCLAVSGDDGTLEVAHRDDAPLVPASTTKLLTAAAAVEVLGGEHRYRTVVAGAAPGGDGTVPGDLVLVGGGDPILASPDYAARYRRQPQTFTNLDELAAALVASGMRRVDGSIVGDESRYDRERYVAGWPARYIPQHVVGPLSALAVNDGFAAYPLAPGDPTPLEPAPDPAAQAAGVLTRLLEARGVEVVGEPRSGTRPDGAAELAAIESPPLGDIVGQMLRESDNSTAELLLKEIGHAAGDPSTPGGAAAATAALSDAGIDLTGVRIVDGSGLSLDDRATCEVLVDVLTGSEPAPILDAGLAVAGESGTLAERFDGTGLEGLLRAKTGTLNTATALAGVVEDADGPLTFALITNVPDGRISLELVASQDELAKILLAWPRVPDVSVLGPLPLEDPPAVDG